MMNRHFEDWVQSVVGERAYLDIVGQPSYKLAMKFFDETIKPSFRSLGDEESYMTFPGAYLKDDPTKGLKCNTITVTAYDL